MKHLILLACFFLRSYADSSFVTSINPGCDSRCNDTLLAYSRLQRSGDSLHVILSVGGALGDLSLSYVQSSEPKQNISINWDKLLSDNPDDRLHALQFAYPPIKTTLAMCTIAFTQLIEYDDKNDKVDPSQNSTRIEHSFADFDWRLSPLSSSDESVVTLTLTANSTLDEAELDDKSIFLPNGWLRLTIRLSADSIRNSQLPRLLFTGNNTQLEIITNRLRTNFANSRFAIGAALLADGANVGQKVTRVATIDDEFTPGNFRIMDWYAVDNKGDNICYLQWKPVYYENSVRNLTTSSVVKTPDLANNLTDRTIISLNDSLPFSLYGDVGSLTGSGYLLFGFGVEDDGYYKAANYSAWTSSFGLGSAPSDSVTALVIIIIACGLGLPILLMTIAGLYLCVKRRREGGGGGGGGGGSGHRDHSSDYQPINA